MILQATTESIQTQRLAASIVRGLIGENTRFLVTLVRFEREDAGTREFVLGVSNFEDHNEIQNAIHGLTKSPLDEDDNLSLFAGNAAERIAEETGWYAAVILIDPPQRCRLGVSGVRNFFELDRIAANITRYWLDNRKAPVAREQGGIA